MEIGSKFVHNYKTYIVTEQLDQYTIRFKEYDATSLHSDLYNAYLAKEDDIYTAIAKWYYTVRVHEGLKVQKNRNIEKEISTVRMCIEKDGIAPDVLVGMLTYALSDKFWSQTGLISLASLRNQTKRQVNKQTQKSGQRKIDSIMNSYNAYLTKNAYKKK